MRKVVFGFICMLICNVDSSAQDDSTTSDDVVESWTIVVYEDEPEQFEGSPFEYTRTSIRRDWKPQNLDEILKQKTKLHLLEGEQPQDVEVQVGPPPAEREVSLQVYASLAHELKLLDLESPIEDKWRQREKDTRQQWSLVVTSPPPKSIRLQDVELNSGNSTMKVVPNASPFVRSESGKPRVYSQWQINCPAAPVLPLECSAPILAEIECADGMKISQPVMVKSCFNGACTSRLYPRRMTLRFPNPESQDRLRTKLLTAFGGMSNDVVTGRAEEPTLFVPLSWAYKESQPAKIVVFVVDSISDPYYFNFAASNTLEDVDAPARISLLSDENWKKCTPSTWGSYVQSLNKNPVPDGVSEAGSKFQQLIAGEGHSETPIVLLGTGNSGPTLRVARFRNGKYEKFGQELSGTVDPDWLQEILTTARSQN